MHCGKVLKGSQIFNQILFECGSKAWRVLDLRLCGIHTFLQNTISLPKLVLESPVRILRENRTVINIGSHRGFFHVHACAV